MGYSGASPPSPIHPDFAEADPMDSSDGVNEGMTEDEFKQFLSQEIREGLSYIDSEIATRRDRNYKYFNAVMDDMPTDKGRSAVIDAVISDHVGFMMPSLLRVMFAGKTIGEYQPSGMEDEGVSKLASEFVNEVVLRKDNDIERVGWGWCFDALVNIVGIVKVWWKKDEVTEDIPVRAMSDDEFAVLGMMLQQQDEKSGVRYEVIDHQEHQLPLDTPLGQIPLAAHDVVIRKTTDKSCLKFDVLPPEEFVISRDARDLADAVLKSHRSYKRAGDLIDMGFPQDVVDSLPDYNTADRPQQSGARRPWDTRTPTPTNDPSMRMIAVHEGIIRCDKDGAGIKDWYFMAAGSQHAIEVLICEPYKDQIDFCDFCPIPIPHSFFGRCPADDLTQIQQVMTNLARGVLDNINLSNMPQREVLVSGILDQRLDYVQNLAPGGLIPVTKLGSVREVAIPFVADKALMVSQFWADKAESRTGVSRQGAGLEADRLQNQAATTALLNDNNSKARLEMIARIWATGGMRKLFRSILRILKRYHTYDRIVRLSGKQQRVSPQEWDGFEEWDVSINTGLGTGTRERDLQMISLILNEQKEILKTMGPSNPLVTLGQYGRALHKAGEITGLSHTEQYFNELPLDYAPPPQPPQPDPAIQKAQIDGQTKLQIEGMKTMQKREEKQIDMGLRIREQDIEALLGKYAIDKKASTDSATNIRRN